MPVESSKGEWGVGQHELNIRYADVLSMADRHVVYKQCLKEFADRLGASVTFMAKVATEQAGSSCHVHMSLWRDGDNAFAGHDTAKIRDDFIAPDEPGRVGNWEGHAAHSLFPPTYL